MVRREEAYVPARGDFVRTNFTPQAGHEQAGRRPALVLSPRASNARSRLALIWPLTTQMKGYPFETPLPADAPVKGVVLADHIGSVDWRARGAELIASAPPGVLAAVLGKIRTLL